MPDVSGFQSDFEEIQTQRVMTRACKEKSPRAHGHQDAAGDRALVPQGCSHAGGAVWLVHHNCGRPQWGASGELSELHLAALKISYTISVVRTLWSLRRRGPVFPAVITHGELELLQVLWQGHGLWCETGMGLMLWCRGLTPSKPRFPHL